MRRLCLFALLASCTTDPADDCYDELDQVVACERLESAALPDDVEPPEPAALVERTDVAPGADDLDGAADEAVGEVAEEYAGPGGGSTAIDFGRTKHAERRKFLPIGRTPGVSRFVVMRLSPADLPRLAAGDVLRAAAELQITTRCDIGQVAPGCGYAPRIRVQLVLAHDGEATDPHRPGVTALSAIDAFDCTANDHHCVAVIGFAEAVKRLDQPCDDCSVNLVAWAYHPDARAHGQDVVLLGANEGDFLANGDIEQDRGRIMAIRERGVGAGDVAQRATQHTVRSGAIELASNGDDKRIYSHTLAGGRDLRAGERFRVWAEVDASSDHRVNLSLEMFLTRRRYAKHGGIADTSPKAIAEHYGTNCSPGDDCHLREVAVFSVDHDVAGPVFVNITASTEVPGPGSATTTIHDSGFVKSLRYAR